MHLQARSNFTFIKDKAAIEQAIIDYIIRFGSKNCWGDLYFCYLDEIKETTLSQKTDDSITVLSRYTLISSTSLESSADKRRFISEFVLKKFGNKYQAINVRTAAFSGDPTGDDKIE